MGGVPVQRTFRRVLVANRGEIAIRVFRALTELGIETVAIYSREDVMALHRYKADEAYLIGDGKGPIEAYLDIEGIVDLARRQRIDAVHPGYGFLAENPRFAQALTAAGIAFIGPTVEQLALFGDKVASRQAALRVGVPLLPASDGPVRDVREAREVAERIGFPVVLKALAGGGGRGQRVVQQPGELEYAFRAAASEAEAAFGDGQLYVERYIPRAKHIEVQVLGDAYGNLVHLYERDCSVQRRHQKMVEIAPAFTVPEATREQVRQAALRLLRSTGYQSAGTVEFLVDEEGNAYFLEVNARIQVEHTVTELVTGIDIVQAQILIAEGYHLSDPPIGIRGQADVPLNGYAIQCRITTEDPENNFVPDTGRIIAYRSAAGHGVRLDTGNVYVGADVSPHYDSLLVKVSTWDREFAGAVARMRRALREFRIRGVKTNIPFLLNLLDHPLFRSGQCYTRFVEETPELARVVEARDRGTKLLRFIAERVVRGSPARPANVAELRKRLMQARRTLPDTAPEPPPFSFKRLLDTEGPEAVAKAVLAESRLLVTDTTFRDAHQSLLATRLRTLDLVTGARATAHLLPGLFSAEVWGGATFDVCLGMLKECPWQRLEAFRAAMPGHLLQMLLRGQNGVGYENIPDNLLQAFIREAAATGIDIFRIFDSLNWVEGQRLAIETVLECGKIAEAAICYTGDILDPQRERFSLGYYVRLAKELAALGVHFLAIKDMAGLLTPYAAERLVRALKEETGLPVHLHTHDTGGGTMATLLKAAEAGVDIVDVAQDPLSGLTSQPAMGTLIAYLRHTPRDTGLPLEAVLRLAPYWEAVRAFYAPFESEMRSPSSEVFLHEMPGGQYTNLRQQAIALGLGDRWEEVKAAYRTINQLLGDIVKVTPSSKMVGDFALFWVENQLTPERLWAEGEHLAFPESVVSYFRGLMGQPPFGYPEELRRMVLKGRPPVQGRPGATLPPVPFDEVMSRLREEFGPSITLRDAISYALYPRNTEDLLRQREWYSDTSILDTATFLYGLEPGEETTVDIEPGKTLYIRLNTVSEPQQGARSVFFELNGHTREIRVSERGPAGRATRPKANPRKPEEIGAPMPGRILKLYVAERQQVEAGQPLFVMEAMKMETTVVAPQSGSVDEVFAREGDVLAGGDLVLRLRLQGLD